MLVFLFVHVKTVVHANKLASLLPGVAFGSIHARFDLSFYFHLPSPF